MVVTSAEKNQNADISVALDEVAHLRALPPGRGTQYRSREVLWIREGDGVARDDVGSNEPQLVDEVVPEVGVNRSDAPVKTVRLID